MADFFCGPCNVQLNSKIQWDQHVIGGKHLRANAKSQPLSNDDLSAAIVLPNNIIKCKTCEDFQCCGIIPFEQHLAGQKHLRNVQRSKESTESKPTSPAKSLSPVYELSMSPVVRSPATQDSSPIAQDDVSSALMQPDGSYKCKICVDFTCTGPIPMQDHLKGKTHLKNLNNSPSRKLHFEQLTISTPASKVDYISKFLTVDKRIEKAWNHPTICGYNYDESFSTFPVKKKIDVLSPHFAFIGKDESMPDFVQYFSK